MNTEQLQALFSQEPAGLKWSASEDGSRVIGTAPGFVLDVWPDRVEAAAVFPPDDAMLAARNGTLLQLLLVAMRPDWETASEWLAQQMKLAARSKSVRPEMTNYTRGVVFVWLPQQSRATLKVRWDGSADSHSA